MTFGERLKAERVKRRLTQDQVAKELCVVQSYVTKLENGTKNPSKEMLVLLAKYYGVSADYLLGLTEEK